LREQFCHDPGILITADPDLWPFRLDAGIIRKVHEQPVARENDMPAEIDFGKAARGVHHIRAGEKIFMPAFVEKKVWEYFAAKPGREAWNFRSF
jgi:hypothetical protein